MQNKQALTNISQSHLNKFITIPHVRDTAFDSYWTNIHKQNSSIAKYQFIS